MKLSIITVNLNNATGLRRTIKSVINQTCKEFEYIIIDGGSTDSSLDIIRSFTVIPQGIHSSIYRKETNHSPISYWVSERDSGIYEAMNKGIEMAKGEYCQFLNSGDWLTTPNVIEEILKSIPDCSIYYGNMLKVFPNGKIYRDNAGKGILSMVSFYQGSLNHSSDFIKRNLFDKYGMYDEKLKIAADWKWYLIAIGLNNEPIKYTDIDVTCFNMRGISSTNKQLLNKERREVLEEYIPAHILSDYDKYFCQIGQLNRVNKNRMFRALFWFMDRVLFKMEKLKRKKL